MSNKKKRKRKSKDKWFKDRLRFRSSFVDTPSPVCSNSIVCLFVCLFSNRMLMMSFFCCCVDCEPQLGQNYYEAISIFFLTKFAFIDKVFVLPKKKKKTNCMMSRKWMDKTTTATTKWWSIKRIFFWYRTKKKRK